VTTADMAGTFAITNVRAVLSDRVLDNATVLVDDGLITTISESGSRLPGAFDGQGLLLLPGLVDSHSDGLEKEISPRRTTTFELGFALQSFESRLRSAGITTAFHGVGYQNKPQYGRSIDGAREVARAIRQRRSDTAAVDHRVLYRLEAREPDALDPLLDDLENRAHGEGVPMLSFEDHTPGQGQFRDPEQYAASIDPTTLEPGETPQSRVAKLMADAAELLEVREKNLARLEPLATSGRIRMLAHDAESPSDISTSSGSGASIAEFPLTLDAAQAARDAGMRIVMGAPNALRGRSHSGNASARDLVAAGLCDVLASDYMPTTMLAAALKMAAEGVCSLPAAVGLITSGPAEMAGLDDRGRIETGRRGDLILVDGRGAWPQVVGVHRPEDRRLAPLSA
jgi:alpha-D-ribose 1-methylphosphonate 5-triphosphate diphosphatase